MADGDKTSSAYSGGYQAFYNSPTFSNFTVACGERYWRIHKLVLSANSEYFTRSCSGHFKEAEANIITLKEDEEEAVAGMIYYLYHGTYDTVTCKAESTNELTFHLWVFTIGDKYAVKGLQELTGNMITAGFRSKQGTDAVVEFVDFAYGLETLHNGIRILIICFVAHVNPAWITETETHATLNEVASAQPRLMYDVLQARMHFEGDDVRSQWERGVTADRLAAQLRDILRLFNRLDSSDAAFAGKRTGLTMLMADAVVRLEKKGWAFACLHELSHNYWSCCVCISGAWVLKPMPPGRLFISARK